MGEIISLTLEGLKFILLVELYFPRYDQVSNRLEDIRICHTFLLPFPTVKNVYQKKNYHDFVILN